VVIKWNDSKESLGLAVTNTLRVKCLHPFHRVYFEAGYLYRTAILKLNAVWMRWNFLGHVTAHLYSLRANFVGCTSLWITQRRHFLVPAAGWWHLLGEPQVKLFSYRFQLNATSWHRLMPCSVGDFLFCHSFP